MGNAEEIDPDVAMMLVREGLESVMPRDMAGEIVADAVRTSGLTKMPTGPQQFFLLVRGPLQSSIRTRHDDETTKRAVAQVEMLLANAFASPGETLRSTVQLPSVAGRVRVVLYSRSSMLGIQLRASLGGEHVQVALCSSSKVFARSMTERTPDLVVIECESLSPADASGVADAVAAAPKAVTLVLLGDPSLTRRTADSHFKALNPAEFSTNQDGVYALLDLIRSRRNSNRRAAKP